MFYVFMKFKFWFLLEDKLDIHFFVVNNYFHSAKQSWVVELDCTGYSHYIKLLWSKSHLISDISMTCHSGVVMTQQHFKYQVFCCSVTIFLIFFFLCVCDCIPYINRKQEEKKQTLKCCCFSTKWSTDCLIEMHMHYSCANIFIDTAN